MMSVTFGEPGPCSGNALYRDLLIRMVAALPVLRSRRPSKLTLEEAGYHRMAEDADSARFRNVVMPHLREAYTLARWITRNRGDAEDVVQEACLRAFRAIDSYSGGNARAWVLTIIRNTAYSWLRKNRSALVVQVEELGDLEGVDLAGNPDTTTPESLLIAENDAARLEAAISSLPDYFREALILRDVQGLEYREIAVITGVPVGTVMSRLARGRSRLISALREEV
jgi:RNA polymerase sigma factor (sigma-70 family)